MIQWFDSYPTAKVAGLLLLLTLAAYWAVLGHEFTNYDDNVYVTENAQVRGGLSGAGVAWALAATEQSTWQPLTWLSFMLDVELYGMDPRGFHLTNLLLHLANTLLLLLVLQRMTGRLWRSAFVAGLFALHPLHVESVAWIAERKDVLSGLCWMLALLAWARYAGAPSARTYWPVALAMALGLMAKPMVVTLPFVLLLLDWWPLGRVAGGWAGTGALAGEAGRAVPAEGEEATSLAEGDGRTGSVRAARAESEAEPAGGERGTVSAAVEGGLQKTELKGVFPSPAGGQPAAAPPPARPQKSWGGLVLEKLPLFALAATSSIVTYLVQQQGGAVRSWVAYPWSERLGNSLVAYAAYLGKTVWPNGLAVLYPLQRQPLLHGKPLAALLLLAAITWWAFRWRRSRRPPFLEVGWLWFLGILVPVIGLVQIGSHAFADRFSYLPLIGLFVIVAWGVPLLFERRPAAPGCRSGHPLLFAAGVATLLVLAWLTRAQVAHWLDSITLFRRATAVTSLNVVAHGNLGRALLDVGRDEEAAEEFRKALAIDPQGDRLYYNLGFVLQRLGRTAEAVEAMEEAVRLDPSQPMYRYNLAVVLTRLGRRAEAMEQLREAVRVGPKDADAHYNLGVGLDEEGRAEEAMEHYREALRLRPGHAQAHLNLAVDLFQVGRYAEAQAEARSAEDLGLTPHPEFLRAIAEGMQGGSGLSSPMHPGE